MKVKIREFFKNLFDKYFEYIPILILTAFVAVVLAVSLKMTHSRYVNFENGKFDLGNMVQMLWNSVHGRFMYLTDYFGKNMPRWGMSHVDPLLLILAPFMYIFETPLVLVFAQLIAVIFSSFILFKIATLKLQNKWSALFIALSYLFYPAIGFILAWTDFHGVTFAMPFFFGAFYSFEKMYTGNNFSKKGVFVFWLLLILSMLGKEEIALFTFLFGLFIFIFRNDFSMFAGFSEKVFGSFGGMVRELLKTKVSKLSLSVMGVSLIWFIIAFFVIIPGASHYRVESYDEFIKTIDVEAEETTYVTQSNYFLKRYNVFGDSYLEVIKNMVTHPRVLFGAWVDGTKPMHFKKTFLPLLFTPLLYPPIFAISLPEFLINYSRVSGGVSTANIENHRISLIVVVLFISMVYGINFLADLLKRYFKIPKKAVILVVSILIFVVNVDKTFEYKNPVYLWLNQAIKRRVTPLVKAESNIVEDDRALSSDLKIGDSLKLVRLERNDRDCAQKIVDFIPENASVSGPDYMGAKLSMRETYALFPALYNQADFVIADVYARKISSVLDVPSVIVNKSIGDILMSPYYSLRFVCGNMAVFEKGEYQKKSEVLPIQSVFDYKPISETGSLIDAEIFRNLYLRDFKIPEKIKRGEFKKADFAYEQKKGESLDNHKLFLTFVNVKTTEYFQVPNLPSYSLINLRNWHEGRFYTEEVDIMIPSYMDKGLYRVFIGLTDGIETRSVYIGEVEVY